LAGRKFKAIFEAEEPVLRKNQGNRSLSPNPSYHQRCTELKGEVRMVIYTPKQLAERWNCCSNTIRNAIISGELQAFRVGRLLRIPQHSVDNFERRFMSNK